MADRSEISWTDSTWNPARGCDKVSEGCAFCYMMRDGQKFGYNGKQVQRTKTVFDMPMKYKHRESKVWGGRPLIFTASLTDFFHPKIDEFRGECWFMIQKCEHLIFQVLTKRPERIVDNLPHDWYENQPYRNVWLGTSVENQQRADERIEILRHIPAALRFLSVEPLLGPVKLDLSRVFDSKKISLDRVVKGNSGIDWVIIGGESGNDHGDYRYRPMELEWVENIIKDCKAANVPVFVKQTGTYLAKKLGLKDRHGRNIDEWPESIKFREFPKP